MPTTYYPHSDDGFNCEFCKARPLTLYEGWFYGPARNNPFAQGTVAAGLMQKRIACKSCVEKAIKSGMTKAKSIPEPKPAQYNVLEEQRKGIEYEI